MITHNRLYAKICSCENLLWAARRAEQGKRMQDTIGRFRTDLEAELLQLRHELVAKTYTPGPYRETIITRPKRRMISAAPFRDRVVHHAVCNVVMPLFERKMIFDPLQGLARMTGLAARFETAGAAQTFWAGFVQTVAGGRLAAVGTVAGHLAFQLLDPLFQLHQTFLQGQDNIHQHFGMAARQGQQFFAREQFN
jgi:hypothetical protein